MKIFYAVAAVAMLASSDAYSQGMMMSNVPSSSKTVSDWYNRMFTIRRPARLAKSMTYWFRTPDR